MRSAAGTWVPASRAWRLGGLVVLLVALLAPTAASAASAAPAHGLPAAYAPIVVEPTRDGDKAEFDLGPAIRRAQRERKWLYVYLGANDCPYCRRYEAFLDKNATELVPHFGKYLVVDLRSSLSIRSKWLNFKAGARSLPYAEFLGAMGDERARQLVYPSVWLLDVSGAQPKPLMQMPAGTGTFETVPEQLEVLRLEQ